MFIIPVIFLKIVEVLNFTSLFERIKVKRRSNQNILADPNYEKAAYIIPKVVLIFEVTTEHKISQVLWQLFYRI